MHEIVVTVTQLVSTAFSIAVLWLFIAVVFGPHHAKRVGKRAIGGWHALKDAAREAREAREMREPAERRAERASARVNPAPEDRSSPDWTFDGPARKGEWDGLQSPAHLRFQSVRRRPPEADYAVDENSLH